MCTDDPSTDDAEHDAHGAGSPDVMSRRDFNRWLGAAALGAVNPSGIDMVRPSDELCYTPAIQLAAMLRAKQVSAREVMQAHLAQIARVNPAVNAIVTLVAEGALADAAAADEELAHGRPR